LQLKDSLLWVLDHHSKLLATTGIAVLAECELFSVAMQQPCSLLTLFTLVSHAIQSDDDTMADVMSNWFFLARLLGCPQGWLHRW